MIACPVCGSETRVTDTRVVNPTCSRRRRVCTARTCPGKITTYEMPLSAESGRAMKDSVLVPKRDIEALRVLVASLATTLEDRDNQDEGKDDTL